MLGLGADNLKFDGCFAFADFDARESVTSDQITRSHLAANQFLKSRFCSFIHSIIASVFHYMFCWSTIGDQE